jgi:uracil-DNA glycosylase
MRSLSRAILKIQKMSRTLVDMWKKRPREESEEKVDAKKSVPLEFERQSHQIENILDAVEPTWKPVIEKQIACKYWKDLMEFVAKAYKNGVVYPKVENVYNAMLYTSFDNVKVVILGQDPYHGPGQAHGLCFSVETSVDIPPSLRNIFKEQSMDLNIKQPKSGNLSKWAKQGVFLLNTVLTVEHSKPNSHANRGWETFTDSLVSAISREKEHVVWMLWGAPAQKKKSLINAGKHLILEAPHPSPLSAHRGFFGSKHFSKSNEYLKSKNKEPIEWQL